MQLLLDANKFYGLNMGEKRSLEVQKKGINKGRDADYLFQRMWKTQKSICQTE